MRFQAASNYGVGELPPTLLLLCPSVYLSIMCDRATYSYDFPVVFKGYMKKSSHTHQQTESSWGSVPIISEGA